VGEQHKQAALALLGEMIEMVTAVMEAARAASNNTLPLDGVDNKIAADKPVISSQLDVAQRLKELAERKV
jgi:hypothetical protein